MNVVFFSISLYISIRCPIVLYIVIYSSDCFVFPASSAMLINIRNARGHFEKLEQAQESAVVR